jgi:hypothetical protein
MDLRKRLSAEILEHAWQFNAKEVATMLSTDGNAPPDNVVKSACKPLPKEVPPNWPPEGGREEEWYKPLAVFLNNCVTKCQSRSGNTSDQYWYRTLKFIVYNRAAEDSVDDATPIKPDLVGGPGLRSGNTAAWKPKETKTKQIQIPVEVKANWKAMVEQAATYARCLFNANPLRQFALALGFQHKSAELRFLVFHRGGLTASEALPVRSSLGEEGIIRAFLSILSYKSAKDAGFFECYPETKITLLRSINDKVGVVATEKEVLHSSLCILGRAPRVLVVDYPCVTDEPNPPATSEAGPAFNTRARKRMFHTSRV